MPVTKYTIVGQHYNRDKYPDKHHIVFNDTDAKDFANLLRVLGYNVYVTEVTENNEQTTTNMTTETNTELSTPLMTRNDVLDKVKRALNRKCFAAYRNGDDVEAKRIAILSDQFEEAYNEVRHLVDVPDKGPGICDDNVKPLKFGNLDDCLACGNSWGPPQPEESEEGKIKYVCANAFCGASTGWCDTDKEAVNAWNYRSDHED
jgi:hypothetical protein